MSIPSVILLAIATFAGPAGAIAFGVGLSQWRSTSGKILAIVGGAITVLIVGGWTVMIMSTLHFDD